MSLERYAHVPQVAPGVAGTVQVRHVVCVEHQVAWPVAQGWDTPAEALAHTKTNHARNSDGIA